MLLSANFSFNVTFHEPCYQNDTNVDYNNTFYKKQTFLEKIFHIRGMSSRINKSFPNSGYLLACTTNKSLSEKYITASRKCSLLIAVFYYNHIFQAREDPETSCTHLLTNFWHAISNFQCCLYVLEPSPKSSFFQR